MDHQTFIVNSSNNTTPNNNEPNEQIEVNDINPKESTDNLTIEEKELKEQFINQEKINEAKIERFKFHETSSSEAEDTQSLIDQINSQNNNFSNNSEIIQRKPSMLTSITDEIIIEPNDEENSSNSQNLEIPEKVQINEDNNSPTKILASRLRAKAQVLSSQKPSLKLTADFIPETSNDPLHVIPTNLGKRKILREKLMERHSKDILSDIREETGQEIQDEEIEEEEEEEEEELNEIGATLAKELEGNQEVEQLSDEEIEKRLYQKAVELRLSEDFEEIKKIIKIITGQWRAGRLFAAEGLEKAFEGDNSERKELEEQRTMRNQRRTRKHEEQKKLTAQSISEMIERAMWVQAGEDENATTADKIRAKLAMTSEKNPKHELLSRLEEKAFVQEEYKEHAHRQLEKSIHNASKKYRKMEHEKFDEKVETQINKPKRVKELRKQSFSFEIGDKNLKTAKKISNFKKEIAENAGNDELDEDSIALQAFLSSQN